MRPFTPNARGIVRVNQNQRIQSVHRCIQTFGGQLLDPMPSPPPGMSMFGVGRIQHADSTGLPQQRQCLDRRLRTGHRQQ